MLVETNVRRFLGLRRLEPRSLTLEELGIEAVTRGVIGTVAAVHSLMNSVCGKQDMDSWMLYEFDGVKKPIVPVIPSSTWDAFPPDGGLDDEWPERKASDLVGSDESGTLERWEGD